MTVPDTCERWTKPLGRDCPHSTDGNHHCTTRADVRHEIHGCACNWVWGGVALPGPVIDELIAMRTENEELVRENEMHRERLRELGPIVAAFTEGDLLGELERLRAEVARLRAGEDDTPWQPDSTGGIGQWLFRFNRMTGEQRMAWLEQVEKWQQGHDRCRTRFLGKPHAEHIADLEAERDQLRAKVAELQGRPTRHAFDEVCRSVELQRVALVEALGGEPFEDGEFGLPFADAVELVRRLEQVRAAATGRWRELADALGIDPSTAAMGAASWEAMIERVAKLAGGA